MLSNSSGASSPASLSLPGQRLLRQPGLQRILPRILELLLFTGGGFPEYGQRVRGLDHERVVELGGLVFPVLLLHAEHNTVFGDLRVEEGLGAAVGLS